MKYHTKLTVCKSNDNVKWSIVQTSERQPYKEAETCLYMKTCRHLFIQNVWMNVFSTYQIKVQQKAKHEGGYRCNLIWEPKTSFTYRSFGTRIGAVLWKVFPVKRWQLFQKVSLNTGKYKLQAKAYKKNHKREE